MSNEAESKLLAALGSVVNSLIRQAEQHQKAVSTLLTQGETANKEVASAAREYRVIASSLAGEVTKAIGKELDGAADRAGDRLAAKFTTADAAAVAAACRYDDAASAIKPKMLGLLVLGWIGTLGIALVIGWYLNARAYELKRENEAFQAVFALLNKSPQFSASITLCGIENGQQLLCSGVPSGKGPHSLKIISSWPVSPKKE